MVRGHLGSDCKRGATEFDEDEGTITDKQTGKTTKIIQAGGVYFVRLLVPKNIAGKPFQPFGRQG